MIASGTVLGRVGLPDDIGGVIASLLLPANGWINAQRIEASGGTFIYSQVRNIGDTWMSEERTDQRRSRGDIG
jgi:hypothetical protein